MKERKKNRTLEDKLFLTGIWCFILGGIALYVYFHVIRPYFPVHSCLFYILTGYYCPGCGGTRAVLALLHGNIEKAFWYHPVVPYSAAVYLIFMVSHLLEKMHMPHVKGVKFHGWYLYVALIIIALNVLVKNISGVILV